MRASACVRFARGRVIPALALGLVTLSATPRGASAQRRPGGGPPGRAQLEQRVRARMAQMIRRELGLSDAEVRALNDVTEEFQSRRRELAARRRDLARSAAALARHRPQEARDEEIRSVLAAMADVHDEEARLYREEQQRLLEILTPWQVLRLDLMRERFAEQIRRMRRERPRRSPDMRGMRRPGGPGDGLAPWPDGDGGPPGGSGTR